MPFKITRHWAMPSGDTFSIKPIRSLIENIFLDKAFMSRCYAVDPFVRHSPFKEKCHCNDLDPSISADSHLDALEFLKTIKTGRAEIVLFDPPYSPRQVSEIYKKMDQSVNMETTQASFWGNMKEEIARITMKGGTVVTCGWNSGGIGLKLGFEIKEILLVAHGGWHNDTIVTVEEKK